MPALRPDALGRIPCLGVPSRDKKCSATATHVEYMRWSCGPGHSYFYYCTECWETPAGVDNRSPKERDEERERDEAAAARHP